MKSISTLVLALTATSLLEQHAAAQSVPVSDLFALAGAVALNHDQTLIRDELQRRASPSRVFVVRIQPQYLSEPAVRLALPAATPLVATRDRVESRSKNDYTYFARLPDSGHLILVVQDDLLTGTITTSDAQFLVRTLGHGLHALVRVDAADYPPEEAGGSPPDEAYGAVPPAGREPPQSSADSGAYLRVLVAYTAAAATAASNNGTTIDALILLAVAETNQAYANSAVTPRLVLAHKVNANYTESGDMELDRDRFLGTSDGHMDFIHALRDEYTADMCQLILSDIDQACGWASAIMATSTTAFCVSDWSCATGNYTFGHELAHLQGCRHNEQADPTNTPFAYGHGYIRCTSPVFRTVMGINNTPCSSTRVQYVSNPNVNYQGVPTGTASTNDNHRVINETAATVDAFRADDLVLQNLTLNSTKVYDAETSVTTGTAVTVQSSGNVTFHAGSTVTLGNGFTAANNSTFRAYVGSGGSSAVSPPVRIATAEPVLDVVRNVHRLRTRPNPFNPATVFEFEVASRAAVKLAVYDAAGREAASLLDDVVAAGVHSVAWHAHGHASGVYFVRLFEGAMTSTQRIVLLK